MQQKSAQSLMTFLHLQLIDDYMRFTSISGQAVRIEGGGVNGKVQAKGKSRENV